MSDVAPGARKAGPPRLSRAQVLQRLLALYPDPRYLEVGVSKGATFQEVEAAQKVAVDPHFAFDHHAWAAQHPETEFHEVPSDEYFARIVAADARFDVIYLDGLHTFEQTLRDLTNALHHLEPRGVILIDDTRPPTYEASLPDQQDARRIRRQVGGPRQWMGDVFKLVYFIESFYPSLSYGTLVNNHGQTVVWRGRRDARPRASVREVDDLQFQDVVLDPGPLRLAPFAAIRRRLRDDLGL